MKREGAERKSAQGRSRIGAEVKGMLIVHVYAISALQPPKSALRR